MTALLIGLASALVAGLAALFLAAFLAAPRGIPAAALLRLYPDVLRLLMALAKDRRVATSVRWRILVAVAYNLQPLNLIPDFVPVIGFADNIIVTAWAVRGAIRKSGTDLVFSHWPGDRAGLLVVCRLCRLPTRESPAEGESAAPRTGHLGSENPPDRLLPEVRHGWKTAEYRVLLLGQLRLG